MPRPLGIAMNVPTLAGGGGGGEFSPLDLAPLLWLDASDSTTLFQDAAGTTPAVANNDPVGLWQEKSGNARHSSQATADARPLLLLNQFNSLPAVKADGKDDLLSFTSFSTGAAFTLYVVAAANTISVGAEYFLASAAMGFAFGGTSLAGYAVWNGSDGRIANEEPTTLSLYVFQSTALYRNGLEATYTTSGTAGAITIDKIFWRSSTLKSDASIGELLLYGATHDATTRGKVETYLNTKWAVYP